MSPYQKGLLLMFAYLIPSAAKDVYIGHLVQSLDVAFVVFFCFVITTGFFLLGIRKWSGFWTKLKTQSKYVMAVNVATLGCWIMTFYAVKYLEPAVALSLMLAVGPCATVFFSPILRPGSQIFPIEYVSAAGIAASMVFTVVGILQGSTGRIGSFDQLFFGVLAAFVVGISAVINNIYAKKLSEAGWSAGHIMATRFWLLIGATGSILLMQQTETHVVPETILSLSGLTLAGIIVPLFCLQKAIASLEPISISVMMSIMPIMGFAFQAFDTNLSFSWLSLIAISVMCAFSLLGMVGRYCAMRKF